MKDAHDILEEHFKRVNPEKDLYIMKTMQPEQYEAMIMAMEEYKKDAVAELVERLADAKYIIKIMYDKIPLEQTTARMSTIISEISILLNKIENENS